MLKKIYLKLLMSLMLVALAVPQGKADELVVGDQSTTSEYVPFYSNYMDMSYDMFSQMIYSTDLLNDIKGAKITTIKLHPTSPVSSRINGAVVQISLKETSQNSFANTGSTWSPSYNVITGMTSYGTCTLAQNATELVFDLSTPFEYSGNENLSVEVRLITRSSSYDQTALSFYGTNQAENVTYYRYGGGPSQDAISFLPKTTFVYESAGPKPEISATPASLNFSTVAGTPVTGNTVTVTGANLTGDITTAVSGANAYYFTVSHASLGTTGGELTVTYNPTAAGNHTATLTLSSAGAQDVTIELNGTATAPTVPTITVNPATLNINAALGETKTANFTVTGANLEGDITIAASEGFTVSPTTIAAADAAAGAAVTVTYVAPATAETKTGTITLTSENAETKKVAITATAADITYDFTVEPESLDFGEVYVGQSNILAVTIRNNGNDNINPVFTFNNNVFTVEDDSYPVYGGTSQTYNIVYTPVAAGTDNGTVQITIGSQTVTVSLTGKGKELAAYDIASSAASGVHNFGDAFVDGTASWSFTITNNGKNDVTPTIEGLAEPFSTTYESVAIASGESATITINFKPTAIQAYGPTSIVVKFAETADFQFDYTLRGNGIENTGTLPPSTYANYSYTWTDDNGDEHTSAYSEIATDPNQMIALLKAIYTDKNMPGNYYRGYKADGTVDTDHPVAYPAIGQITVDKYYKTEFLDAYGWGMNHDETTYPTQEKVVSTTANEHKFYYMNPNEYKPNQEGLTLLLVEMNDGVGASTITTKPTDYASLKNIYSKMFKSVRVIPNSKRVSKNGVEGTLFKIDCDKMNRFFFLAKGRLRFYDEYEQTHGLGASAYARATKKLSGSGAGSVTTTSVDRENSIPTVNPFNAMYEQFSPVSLSSSEASSDVYQLLINMESYDVEHDCEAIPWASSESVSGHEFNMYGKDSESADCQDVRDLMFFVPDNRMMYYSGRDKGASDMFVNYYKQYAPNMGMYVIRQNEITGEQKTYEGNADNYELHLTWDSNLTDFVPADNGVYYIYQVNEDGSYTKVGETNAQTKEFYVNVPMKEHGQQVTYVIQGQDNTGFLSLQFSNEESFIIPGLDPNEKFQMMAGAEYYSRFDPQTVQNFYANGMQVMAYPDAATNDYAGQTFNFYRKAAGDADWTLVGTAQVNTDGTEATVSMVEGTQRQQNEYKFGYKQNPATVAVTTDANGNKVFGVIFDNFKADVSTNKHPSSYSYKMEVANTSLHSNEISIKVYKTQMRNLTGTFTEEYVENDEVRQDIDNSRQFDIDVEHSSKTDILRYGAYRWNSSYGTSSNPFAILNLNSTEEEDISPQGQASNQGEFYSVYMNGDSYIGDDVYVAQGETGQATFVDDVPATTNAAEEYTYVPVIETFTGRADYNTYGAPMQTTATGKILVNVENAGKSEYTWEADGNTYRYYNVFVNVNTLDLPEGYEVAKVRAWRKIDASYLNEKLEAYAYRADLDTNGEFMFDDPATADDGFKLGGETLGASGPQGGAVYKGTFGALDVENGATVPMKFFVRIYFKKNDGSKAANDEYYITEVEVDGELNNQIPTSIFGVQSYKVVTGIKYYNMAGVESDVPFNGVNIEVTTYDDGSRSSRKIMK